MDVLRSDEFLSIIVPLVVYWIYSGFCEILGRSDKYRLHSRSYEETNNLVLKREVIKGVLLQQAIQATIALTLFKVSYCYACVHVHIGILINRATRFVNQLTGADDNNADSKNLNPTITVIAVQIFVAMLVFDTWQYFVHRCMHLNKFLYRNFHSWHHRLAAPYAYGAQYNHPVDGILTETLAGAVAFFVSGMSVKTSIFFFSFATIKGIDDHCGFMFPWNPFHMIFSNNTAYHEIHHLLTGSKYNFSQPFFVIWDKILGTYVPYKLEKREGGGYEARILKVPCD